MELSQRLRVIDEINERIELLGEKQIDAPTAESDELDFSLPDKIPEHLILQNRNRSGKASVAQMQSIAANPDYDRLSVTKDFGSGAPVVAYGKIPPAQLGRKTKAVMQQDGYRYDVCYAVVEAGEVLTSNDINGTTNGDYFSDDSGRIRAIAGNGRITGLTQAYKDGTADEYRKALEEDREHGVSAAVIAKMKAPILVRVMQPKDVTKDIGDLSNRQGGLVMSAVEQANNDKQRINFGLIKTDESGQMTLESIRSFVGQMPREEQGQLIDSDGHPTVQAELRAKAAVFAKAYNNDELTRQMAQALEPEARNIINGMTMAGPAMARLAGLEDGFDVRDIVTNAANKAMQAIRSRMSLEEMATQTELFTSEEDNEAAGVLLKMFATNRRSAKAIADSLIRMANGLYEESFVRNASLFGEETAVSRQEIVQKMMRYVGSAGSVAPGRGMTTVVSHPQPEVSMFDSVNTSDRCRDLWKRKGGGAMRWLLTGRGDRPEEFFDSLTEAARY